MRQQNPQLSLLLISLTIFTATVSGLTVDSPQVGDWKDAINEDGLVRIPLRNPSGHSWFASLQLGTPKQNESMCAIDNNHAMSIVFSKDCLSCPEDIKNKAYNSKKSETFMTRNKHEMVVRDDGFILHGFTAADTACIGGWLQRKSATYQEETICMDNQLFFHADRLSEYDWPARATNKRHINAICGLGKEKTSGEALGMLARAKKMNLIDSQTYSVTLVPQELAQPLDRDRGKKFPQDKIMRTSFLTIGGWAEEDLASDIAWFTAENTWNQTLDELRFDGVPIVDFHDYAHVAFETGYPYIGMSEEYYDRVSSYLMTSNMNVNCTRGQHWGLCRVENVACSQLPLDMALEITIEGHRFTMPLKNIASDVVLDGKDFCHINIAMLNPSDQRSVILGSAFFTAFVGIFDVDGERLGLAESARALSGNSMTCVIDNCKTEDQGEEQVDMPEPDGPSSNPVAITITQIVFVTILILTVVALVTACICKRRKRILKERKQGLNFIEGEDDIQNETNEVNLSEY